MDAIALRGITLGLASVVLLAAAIKASQFWPFVAVVRSWGLEDIRVARAIATLIVVTEVGVGGFALSTGVAMRAEAAGRVALAALLVSFVAGQAVILLRRRDASCGCFGRPARIGRASLARVGVLAAVAVVVSMPGSIASARAEAPQWAYPATTRTGVPSVDAAIAAVTSGNPDALAEALDFTDFPCSTSPGLGGFQCPSGTPNGTVMPVVFIGSCELAGTQEGGTGLDTSLQAAARDGLFLHSVARVTEAPIPPYPLVRYRVFFGSASDPGVAGGTVAYSPVDLGVTDEGVAQIGNGCAASVADKSSAPGLEFLLAPRSVEGATTTPVVPAVGTGMEDGADRLSDWLVVAAVVLAAAGGLGGVAGLHAAPRRNRR